MEGINWTDYTQYGQAGTKAERPEPGQVTAVLSLPTHATTLSVIVTEMILCQSPGLGPGQLSGSAEWQAHNLVLRLESC